MATAPRLAPGTTLVTVPGRGLALRTPDGDFLHVDTAATDPQALTAALTTGVADPDPELDRLITAFERAGYARPSNTEPVGRIAGRTVLLLGDPQLLAPLDRFVRAEGGQPRSAAPAELAALGRGPRRPRTAVVWCLDTPVPPGLWDEADHLPARGTAWLRCHREGAQVWLEPLADRPGDVTAAHVRRRRLAATPAHRELDAYWQGLRTPETESLSTATSAALIASLLTADLIAWAAGDPGSDALPLRRRLRRLDLRDLTVTQHPVLPVPDVAPLPARTGP
ncbi:hypothetical protein [Streptomyces sp. NBC_00690]|uniref:hypothetical protein n=1 Tax=Streptomyces sp. NBC_00690 TaxID=2975808 RepID=UPI002E27BCA0|nr:hypothetical protein [Streptomyces sp. NBC_00690]